MKKKKDQHVGGVPTKPMLHREYEILFAVKWVQSTPKLEHHQK